MMKLAALALIILGLGLAAYVRVRPLEPELLHIDPTIAERPSFPGHALVRDDGDLKSPVFMMPADQLADALKTTIERTPRTFLLAGDLDDLHATYVTRSQVFGFPDVASIKVNDLGDGMSSVTILSRLQIGSNDMGVNQARVQMWMKSIQNAR